MARKRDSQPRFLPCVATHYRNVMRTKLKQVETLREKMIGEYFGFLVPGLEAQLATLETETLKTLVLLDSVCSDPQFPKPVAAPAAPPVEVIAAAEPKGDDTIAASEPAPNPPAEFTAFMEADEPSPESSLELS